MIPNLEIMNKVPLSDAGIIQLQTNLYALSDAALLAEAKSLHQDFASWLDDHIILDNDQLTWFKSIDKIFRDYISAKTAIALINRLPITLELPPVPPAGSGANKVSGKWFQDKDSIAPPKWEGAGVIITSGELSFKLGYNT